MPHCRLAAGRQMGKHRMVKTRVGGVRGSCKTTGKATKQPNSSVDCNMHVHPLHLALARSHHVRTVARAAQALAVDAVCWASRRSTAEKGARPSRSPSATSGLSNGRWPELADVDAAVLPLRLPIGSVEEQQVWRGHIQTGSSLEIAGGVQTR